MEAQTSSKKEDGGGEDSGSREATPRTSIDSTGTNTSDFIVQSPSLADSRVDVLTPNRYSVDEIRNLQNLSRQALSRRLSTLSTSSFGDIGDNNLNWNPREAGING
jgi:hypothetical protein